MSEALRPEALRLADYFDYHGFFDSDRKAAAELRRLHEVNAELVGILQAYTLSLTGDLVQDNHEFGVFEVAREMRRRAALTKAGATT